MKSVIRAAFGLVGLEVRRRGRTNDQDRWLELYEALYTPDSLSGRHFYNIGAGAFRHPHWTNIDYVTEWYPSVESDRFINHDLLAMKPLPISDGSAGLVYTSHTIEHLTDDAVSYLFREVRRILKPGGIFRLTTPDAALAYEALRRGDRQYFFWIPMYSQPEHIKRAVLSGPMRDASLHQVFLQHIAGQTSELHGDSPLVPIDDKELERMISSMPMEEVLDSLCSRCRPEIQRKYPGNHISWWTYGKIERFLRDADFSSVYRSGYGQSFAPVMRDLRLFDCKHPQVSLYMETVG